MVSPHQPYHHRQEYRLSTGAAAWEVIEAVCYRLGTPPEAYHPALGLHYFPNMISKARALSEVVGITYFSTYASLPTIATLLGYRSHGQIHEAKERWLGRPPRTRRKKVDSSINIAKVTTQDILDAVMRDDHRGFCLSCGEEAFNVEPDARKYECDTCGERQVYGAEELLIMEVGVE